MPGTTRDRCLPHMYSSEIRFSATRPADPLRAGIKDLVAASSRHENSPWQVPRAASSQLCPADLWLLCSRRKLRISRRSLKLRRGRMLAVRGRDGFGLGMLLTVVDCSCLLGYRGTDKEDRLKSTGWQDQDQVQGQVPPLPLHPLPRRPGEG